jgi:hypothetical protein
MAFTFSRIRSRYTAIGFLVLVPVMTYYVLKTNEPKIILVILIPLYLVLARSFWAYSNRA